MFKKHIGILIFLTLFLTPFCFSIAQTSNTGFIPENIWYSKDPFEEGDKIKIFTLIYNSDTKPLSGTVFFFDKTTFLGNKNFNVAVKGIQDISIDWVVTAGDHTIFAQIQSANYLMPDKTYKEASLSEIKTSESKSSVPKKISTNTTKEGTTIKNTDSTVSNIQNFVKENIPEVVSKTIETTINATEGFRENLGNLSEDKKEMIKKEIKALEDTSSLNSKPKNPSTAVTGTQNNNSLIKPFKYVEVFFLALFSYIFNNKYLFYGLIFMALFFIIRFLFRKLF